MDSGISYHVDATNGSSRRLGVKIEIDGPFNENILELRFPRWVLVHTLFENQYNTCQTFLQLVMERRLKSIESTLMERGLQVLVIRVNSDYLQASRVK